MRLLTRTRAVLAWYDIIVIVQLHLCSLDAAVRLASALYVDPVVVPQVGAFPVLELGLGVCRHLGAANPESKGGAGSRQRLDAA
jgi:hypothetical protein